MKATLSERNIVIALFIMVLVTFALAQEDTRKMEKGFTATNSFASSHILMAHQKEKPKQQPAE